MIPDRTEQIYLIRDADSRVEVVISEAADGSVEVFYRARRPAEFNFQRIPGTTSHHDVRAIAELKADALIRSWRENLPQKIIVEYGLFHAAVIV